MSSDKNVVTSSASELLTGRVKWFNNKAGYGFITVTDGSKSGSDIFIHHSAINVDSQQYKYLVQGEYVGFALIKTTSGSHEWQASNVSGINGGKLMCETRHEFKLARSAYKTDLPKQVDPSVNKSTEARTKEPRTKEPRTQDPKQQPIPKNEDSEEWTKIEPKTKKPRGPYKKSSPNK
jgi:cold shock CspA family protein